MITSTANPLVKDLARLRQRRHRDRQRRFLIEGRREVARALAANVDVLYQVVCPALGGEAVDPGRPVTEMAEAPFRRISQRQTPDGVIAVATYLDTDLDRLAVGPSGLLLVAEGIEKPGNLGAMLRTAAAFGVAAVIAADPTTDVHNPNVVRASQGGVFLVPVAVAPSAKVVAWLGERSIPLVATAPEAPTPAWEVPWEPPLAVAIGAEATGLSAQLRAAARWEASIPMAGPLDSLNASVAAAIALYEATRGRLSGRGG